MNKKEELTDREWEELASLLSEESGDENQLVGRILPDDISKVSEQWKELRNMDGKRKIDVDSAWNKVDSRIQENQPAKEDLMPRSGQIRLSIIKIAAMAILLVGVGSMVLFINNSVLSGKNIRIEAGVDQRNLKVDLPDGSTVYLNRNSELTYKKTFDKNREVMLTGEAFFEVAPNPEKPFIIDAGNANVRVVGTSFNVITDNKASEVEVYVSTGKVILENTSGKPSLELEPGFIGKMNSEKSDKILNADPNYLAWNTGRLDYKSEKLEVVFRDLKKVYNMDIVTEDPSILQYPWTSPIDYQSQERIILMICTSFNLSYTKDGNVYNLSKK